MGLPMCIDFWGESEDAVASESYKPDFKNMSTKQLNTGLIDACAKNNLHLAEKYAKHGARFSQGPLNTVDGLIHSLSREGSFNTIDFIFSQGAGSTTAKAEVLLTSIKEFNYNFAKSCLDYGASDFNYLAQAHDIICTRLDRLDHDAQPDKTNLIALTKMIEDFFHNQMGKVFSSKKQVMRGLSIYNPRLTQKFISQYRNQFNKNFLTTLLYDVIKNKQHKSLTCLLNYGANPNFEDRWETSDLLGTVLNDKTSPDKTAQIACTLFSHGYKITAEKLVKYFEMDSTAFEMACSKIHDTCESDAVPAAVATLYRHCLENFDTKKCLIIQNYWPLEMMNLSMATQLYDYTKHFENKHKRNGVNLEEKLSQDQYARYEDIARKFTDNYYHKKRQKSFICAPHNIYLAQKRHQAHAAVSDHIAPLFKIIVRQTTPVLGKKENIATRKNLQKYFPHTRSYIG